MLVEQTQFLKKWDLSRSDSAGIEDRGLAAASIPARTSKGIIPKHDLIR